MTSAVPAAKAVEQSNEIGSRIVGLPRKGEKYHPPAADLENVGRTQAFTDNQDALNGNTQEDISNLLVETIRPTFAIRVQSTIHRPPPSSCKPDGCQAVPK